MEAEICFRVVSLLIHLQIGLTECRINAYPPKHFHNQLWNMLINMLAMSYHVTVTNCRSFLPRGSPNLPSSVYSSSSSWLLRSRFTFDVKTSSFLIKTEQIWRTELYAKPSRRQQGQYNNVQYNVFELVSVSVQRICKAHNNYKHREDIYDMKLRDRCRCARGQKVRSQVCYREMFLSLYARLAM